MKKLLFMIIICLNLFPSYQDHAISFGTGQIVTAQPIPCPTTGGGSGGGFWNAIGNFFSAIGSAIGSFFSNVAEWLNSHETGNTPPGEGYGGETSDQWAPPYTPDPQYGEGGGPFDPSTDPFFEMFEGYFSQFYSFTGELLNPSTTPDACPVSVEFKEHSDQLYGFDNYGANSTVPWKSVESNKMDIAIVDIHDPALFPNVYLKCADLSVAALGNNFAKRSPFELNIFAQNLTSNGVTEIQANCRSVDGTNISKMNVAVYPTKTKTVLVTRVNSLAVGAYTGYTSTNISDATISDFLNNHSYNQGVVKWVITRADDATLNFDANQDYKLESGERSSSGEENVVYTNVVHSGYDVNLILIDNPTRPVVGRSGSGFTFIYAGSLSPSDYGTTIAHEFGHSAFGFSDISSGDTTNFMWYMSTPALSKFRKDQWDRMHQ